MYDGLTQIIFCQNIPIDRHERIISFTSYTHTSGLFIGSQIHPGTKFGSQSV